MLEVFAITAFGVAMGQAAPGPNLLAVAGVALGHGRMLAILTAFGVAVAIFIWVALVAFGLGTFLDLYPAVLTAMKLLGGFYLCFLAFKAMRAAFRTGNASIVAREGELSPFGAFKRGFLVNVTNPKSALLWISVATFMFASGLNVNQVLAFAPIGAMTAFVIYGAYGMLFSTGRARDLYDRFARFFEFAFGSAFGLIGGKLMFDGLKEIKAQGV